MRTNEFHLPLFSWPLAACLMVAAAVSMAPGCEREEERSQSESRAMMEPVATTAPPEKEISPAEEMVMELPSVDEIGFELFVEDPLRLPHEDDPSVDQLAVGQEALDRGDHAPAVEAFRKAAFDTESYEAFLGLGRAARLAGDTELAIEAFSAAARAGPGHAEPLVMAARLTLSAGDIETGLGFIDRAIGREPDRADAHNVRGRLWMAQEQYHRAILSFDRAIELDPAFAWAWNNKGYVQLLTGRYEEAVEALETAVSLSPATAYMHNNLGLAYEGSGLYRKAEAAFSEALALRPQYVNATVNMERIQESSTALAEVDGEGPAERDDGSLEFVPGG